MSMNDDLQLLKIIFDNLNLPVYIIDHAGRTLYANNATFEMYHCTQKMFEEYYSDTYYMLKHGSFGKKNRSAYIDVIEKKAAVGIWNELVDIDQTVHRYYTSQQPIFDGTGEVKYVIGVCYAYDEISRIAANAPEDPANVASLQLISGKHNSLLYCSPEMQQIVQTAGKIAKTSVNILVLGETGAGKDVIANYIHEHSPRGKNEIICVNCAALPQTVFESEMFGYARGAFTGADAKGKPGLIELANHSTLFLDEIDSLPLEQQGKLLRVLETKLVRRIGGSQMIPVDFRLIAATNKNLLTLIRNGSFREDLYDRLNTFSINVPPLRERTSDIRLLADHFLRQYCTEYQVDFSFSPHAYRQLETYSWPGNVRQLKHLVERSALLTSLSSASSLIDHIDFDVSDSAPESTLSVPTPDSLESKVCAYEKQVISDALKQYGTPSRVAKALNVSLPTISRKMAKYDLSK